MIAADLHVLGQARIEAAAIVVDGRDLAVNDLRGPHDLAAKHFADGLMAEADAEDWHLAAQGPDEVLTDTGILWHTRARRDHDALIMLRLNLGHRRLIMADDLDIRPEFRQQLIDIIGEGIVII